MDGCRGRPLANASCPDGSDANLFREVAGEAGGNACKAWYVCRLEAAREGFSGAKDAEADLECVVRDLELGALGSVV